MAAYGDDDRDRRKVPGRRLPGFDPSRLRGLRLSRREIEILEIVADGATNEAVAQRLSISRLTVKKHLERMYTATGARNRTGLIALLSDGSRSADPGPLAARHNLPMALTSFIGREREIDEISACLGNARLVTLGGPGGIGKTRLAIEVAARSTGEFADGAWLVDLGDISDPRLALQRVSTTLGVRESGHTRLGALVRELRQKDLLIVLDTCEHLTSTVADVVEALLRGCRTVRVLATSREPIGVPGEIFRRVPPLSLPQDDRSSTPVAAAQDSEAVRLFVERAALHRPGDALTATHVTAIVRICRELDGIPLAIELAAARSNVLSVEELAMRLDDPYSELRSDSARVVPRHRTLRSVVEWSYQLLPRAEAKLFERLSVFVGGCTLVAAEAVCADATIARSDILGLIAGLVDRSLLVADIRGPQTRYRSLETLHRYGRDRLRVGDDAEAVRRRHAAFYCALAETAEPELRGPDQVVWSQRLDADQDNLRAALRWSIDEEPVIALRLAGALWRYWFHRGMSREGVRWLESALEGAPAASPEIRAKALNGAGNLLETVGDHDRSEAIHRQCLALRRELDDRAGVCTSLSNLGDRVRERGDHAQARALYEEGLDVAREIGSTWRSAVLTAGLASIAFAEGDWFAAEPLFTRALVLARRSGDPGRAAHVLHSLGVVVFRRGRVPRATALYRRSLIVFRGIGDRVGATDAVAFLGSVAAAEGRGHRAAKLLGAAQRSRELVSDGHWGMFAPLVDDALTAARATVGPDQFAQALAAGEALSLDEAMEYALSRSD